MSLTSRSNDPTGPGVAGYTQRSMQNGLQSHRSEGNAHRFQPEIEEEKEIK